MENEKRMAGDYEITNSFHIGKKEVVMGVNPNTPDAKYMVAFCEKNDLFALYNEVMVESDIAEIAKLYGQRIVEQAESVQKEIEDLGIPVTVITKDDCIPDSYDKSIVGKVVAIKPEILFDEYQRADRQLVYVIGGFGADANSRGQSVYCRNLYDRKEERFERRDVLGEVKPDRLPDWAKEAIKKLPEKKKHKDRER